MNKFSPEKPLPHQERSTTTKISFPPSPRIEEPAPARVIKTDVIYHLPTPNGRSQELERYGYQIISCIKNTDNSFIFLGKNSLENQVCIKAIPINKNNKFSKKKLAAAVNEAEYAALPSLASDTVTTQDFIIDKEAGFAFIIMDLFHPKKRPTLEQLVNFAITNKIDLPASMIFEISSLLTEVLEKVDQEKILHRDIKHGNVYVEFDDEGKPKKVWLGDFGLAQTKDQARKKSDTIQGTLSFLSPERIEGTSNPHPVDHRSDIYSLAVMTHYLLTKRLYFLTPEKMLNYTVVQSKDKHQLFVLKEMRSFHQGNIPLFTPEEAQKLSSQGINVKKLEQALAMGLAREPQDRYENYKAFSIALNRTIDDPFFAQQFATENAITNTEDTSNTSSDDRFMTVLLETIFITTIADLETEPAETA